MRQWKFSVLVSAILIPCGMTVMAYFKDIGQMTGILFFVLGLYAGISGVYYYNYHRNMEFET